MVPMPFAYVLFPQQTLCATMFPVRYNYYYIPEVIIPFSHFVSFLCTIFSSDFAFDPAFVVKIPKGPCDTFPYLEHGNLRVALSADRRLRFERVADGRLLLEEARPRSFTVNPNAIVGGQPALSSSLSFAAYEDERIYGLGQPLTGHLDLKVGMPWSWKFQTMPNAPGTNGTNRPLIPILHSSRGYSLLHNNPGFGRLNISAESTSWTSDACLLLDLWVATNPAGTVVIILYINMSLFIIHVGKYSYDVS